MTPPTLKPTFKHRLEYGIFLILEGILGRLPWATVQAIGEATGMLFYMVDPRHRRIVRENMRFADLGLNEAETRALSRACFRHFGALFIGLLRLRRATPEELDRWIKVEGLEHFDAAQAGGKGFIQLTGHYGNWEAVALAQSRHGRTLDVIGREMDNPLLEPISNGFRTRFGNRVIFKDGAVRESLKSLKAGRGLGFLLDQDALTMGVWVKFLGQWASTFGTAGMLATRFGLPILPVFSWPNPDGTITVRFEAPFEVPVTGDAILDAQVATQLMTSRIEGQIRKDPRWWFWMHRRFKTRPSEAHPLPTPILPQE
jgi:KDO2-lipid IV(A) lauroyltransferase